MKKLLLTSCTFILFFSPLFAGTLDNKLIGVSTEDSINGYLVVPMMDDGYLLASYDKPVVARLDAQGQVLWAKLINLTTDAGYYLYDAGIFSDSTAYLIYLLDDGHSVDSFIVIKLGMPGNILWSDQFTFPFLTQGAYPQRKVVAKPQSDCSLLFAASLTEELAAVKINADGSSVKVCIIRDTTQSKNPCMDVESTVDSGIIVCGKDNNDVDIVCLNFDYTRRWILHYKNGLYNRPYSIIRSSGGNYFIGGTFYDPVFWAPYGIWLMKMSPTGNLMWDKQYSGITETVHQCGLFGLTQLKENNDGTLSALGIGINLGNYMPFVYLKIDTDGQVLTANCYVNMYPPPMTHDYIKSILMRWESVRGSMTA